MSWATIVNTAKRDISKVVGIAGKDANLAIKLFIKIEPVAVTALTPFCPEAAPILATAYAIAEKVELDLTATGATKLQMATGIFTDAVVPVTESALNLSGKTIDATKVAALAPDLFNAIVAENNAQATVETIIQTAVTNKTVPDAAALSAAEAAIAIAVAAVKTAGIAIQSAVQSIAPAAAVQVPTQA